jgi:uncharacterized alkaline shock family protein YloU
MEGHAVISPEVLARYAADAARDVEGVSALAESALPRARAASVRAEDGTYAVEVHVELEWGRSAAEVGLAVQRGVRDYLERMAAVTPSSVDVLVDGIGSPPASP